MMCFNVKKVMVQCQSVESNLSTMTLSENISEMFKMSFELKRIIYFSFLKTPSTNYSSSFKCFPNVLELLDVLQSGEID